ncbi:MAG: hypothetical protein ACK4PI_08685 [Tepidisphaerales bacterium]
MRQTGRAERIAAGMYVAGAAAWVVGVWMLPPGHLLWPAAVFSAAAVPLVARWAGWPRRTGSVGPAWATGVWWGIAAFVWWVPHAGFPYRPDVLYPLLASAVALALALQAIAFGRAAAWAAATAVWAFAIAWGATAIWLAS